RDETVAALSRHCSRLAEIFRIPTPAWTSVEWAWDKRKTYALATRLGIPVPRTWQPRGITELLAIDAQPPFAIKPAIKERFIYATRAKAWRADTRSQLVERYIRAAAIVGPDEVIVQELIPGDGRRQLAYCALYKEGEALGSMV